MLDEAQRIKNWATKTAPTVKRLKPEFRLVLTGTPMENRLEELASIVEWVDDRALEPKWRLVPWHSAYADGKREVGRRAQPGFAAGAAGAGAAAPGAGRGARPAAARQDTRHPGRAHRRAARGA